MHDGSKRWAQRWVNEWIERSSVVRDLVQLKETIWLNDRLTRCEQALPDTGLTAADAQDAQARCLRFAPYVAHVFPETAATQGIIESPLRAVPRLRDALGQRYNVDVQERLLLKMDSHLPISGSIKARGGIYEVLCHAEALASQNGLLSPSDNYCRLADDACRALFSRHAIAVGSTGNLGLSIGIMGAQLGFQVTVHMSAEAQSWKKALLRDRGVHVIEHESDYSLAVAQGRRQAARDPVCHFVDDENSLTLFLGYAVAAERLHRQLDDLHIAVDDAHPLFVYLPCGVGGAPGGVTFGLKLRFGDHVHCIFAEPTHSPCMLLGVHTGLHHEVSVQDFGIDNQTDADGLAVGRPSSFVGQALQRLISGFYTIDDHELYALLALTADIEQIGLEPSAVAGLPGMIRIQNPSFQSGLHLSSTQLANATHIAWATGGAMVPGAIMADYVQTGRRFL